MGHAAGELPERFHLLRIGELLVGALERRGRFLLGADVPARDIDQPVVRRHRPGDPAPGAVLVPKAIFYPYGRPAARELIARGERMRRIVRMAQLVHVQAFDLRVAPPERLRPRRIDADEVAREGRNAEQILGDVPDAVAFARAPFDLGLEPLVEGGKAQLRLLALGDVEQRSEPALHHALVVHLRRVDAAQHARTDRPQRNRVLVFHAISPEHALDIRNNHVEGFFADDVANGFADNGFRRQPDHFGVGPADEEKFECTIAARQHERRAVDDVLQRRFPATQGVLGAASFDREAKLAGDGQGKIDLGVAEWARPIVIDHELADQLAVRQQRNESERADALTAQERFQRRGQIGMGNVVDADRAWLGFLGAPRRMSGDGVAVFLRQSAPRDEAHDAVIVEQQDGDARAAQGGAHGVHAGAVDVRGGFGAKQPFGEFVQGGQLIDAAGQGPLGAITVGQVGTPLAGRKCA